MLIYNTHNYSQELNISPQKASKHLDLGASNIQNSSTLPRKKYQAVQYVRRV